MAVTVEFLGLCLFVWEKDHVRVLLPRADVGDGIKNEHHPYFVDRQIGTPQELSGHKIQFGAGPGRPRRGATNDLINLYDLVGGLRPRPSADLFTDGLLAAEVILRGGELSVTGRAPAGPGAYTNVGRPDPRDTVACTVTWTLKDAEVVTVHLLRDGSEDVEHHGRRLVIGNTDDPMPPDWECHEVPCEKGSTVKDQDFAWYYRLFDGVDTNTLPLPEANCDVLPLMARAQSVKLGLRPGFTATTSTCYSGEYCGGEDYPC